MKNAIEIVQMAFRYDNVKEPQFSEISCLLFTSLLLLQISRSSLLQIQIQNIFNNIYCDVLKTIIQSSK